MVDSADLHYSHRLDDAVNFLVAAAEHIVQLQRVGFASVLERASARRGHHLKDGAIGRLSGCTLDEPHRGWAILVDCMVFEIHLNHLITS